MIIAIASGKGGTGKTLVATNLAAALGAAYVDCDVEGANGHIFLKPEIAVRRPAAIDVPEPTDACTGCGACAKVCRFGSLAALKSGVLVFNELCHSCGACIEACPSRALRWTKHVLGHVRLGRCRAGRGQWLPFADGELTVGQVRASAVIHQVKQAITAAAHTIIDCPPGGLVRSGRGRPRGRPVPPRDRADALGPLGPRQGPRTGSPSGRALRRGPEPRRPGRRGRGGVLLQARGAAGCDLPL